MNPQSINLIRASVPMSLIFASNVAVQNSANAAAETTERAPLRARASWMLFDWATQPYYTLVQTFLFAPYFANAVVENATCGSLIKAGSEQATCGQALWGYAAAVIGFPFQVSKEVTLLN